MGRGRPPAPGKVFYLGRLRYRPGIDPPELRDFLEKFEQAPAERKPAILRAALVGGLSEATEEASAVEDEETTNLLDGLLGDF